MINANLLIVEDDPNLGQILKEYLEIKGFRATLCQDGELGLEAFKVGKYDCCLLDVMMPKKDGFTLGKEIRLLDKKTPFIFLTAKTLKEDTFIGLKIGADDYLTKPFSMEELLLRLEVILRRTNGEKGNNGLRVIEFGRCKLNYGQQELLINENTCKLTTRESELLLLLAQNLNETVDRSDALKLIWRDDSYFNARSMDVYITKLRKHLKADESIKIMTVHGQGFRLVNFT